MTIVVFSPQAIAIANFLYRQLFDTEKKDLECAWEGFYFLVEIFRK
jgi:hypothetical protein